MLQIAVARSALTDGGFGRIFLGLVLESDVLRDLLEQRRTERQTESGHDGPKEELHFESLSRIGPIGSPYSSSHSSVAAVRSSAPVRVVSGVAIAASRSRSIAPSWIKLPQPGRPRWCARP